MHFISKKTVFYLIESLIVLCWLMLLASLIQRRMSPSLSLLNDSDQKTLFIDAEQQRWREIFFKDKKLGYAVSKIKPFKDGYFIQEEMFLKLNLMGMANGLKSITQSYVNEKFLLKEFLFSLSSGAVRFQITGKVEPGRILITNGTGRRKRTQTIAIIQPPMLSSCINYFLKSHKFQLGESISLPLFDPSTLSQKEAIFVVKAKENIEINKVSYQAFRMETELWGKVLTIWMDENGETLKEEGFMGLSTIKSNAESAAQGIEEEAMIDFYEYTAIQPDKTISNERSVGFLRLKIEGLEHANLSLATLNAGRQKFGNNLMEIKRETVRVTAPFLLPNENPAEELKVFLQPELNIESDDPEIRAQVHEIIGTERNPVIAARKLLKWVYEHVEKRPVISIPSAHEVLLTKVGDCNEHATLLTAFLRAAGIPARLSIGLVSARNRFFYHAWTEAYLGEWVSMDATLNQMPVDATHIKLVEGNLDRQAELSGLVGEIKLKILEYHYD
jgi:hypothetical protein